MSDTWAARLLAAAVLATFLAGAALADRETAQFAASRGDKALAAKKWDEAEGHFRKALEEDDTYLAARYGLAQALLGGGKAGVAIEELRGFVEAAKADPALAAECRTLVAKAQKQLADLDAAGAGFQKIQDGYADGLVDLAQKWLTKDPPTAERALRRALKLKPGHARATQLLEKMGKQTGEVVELFDGRTAKGWVHVDAPVWQITEDATLVGGVRDDRYFVRTDRKFEGDFTVKVEARVLEEYAQPVYFAFTACWKSQGDYYSLGVLRGKVMFVDKVADKNRDIAVRSPPEFKTPFDATQWNTYEIRLQGDTVTALVNGEEMGREERPEWRQGGFVGLEIQHVKVAFRRMRVEVR